jgi:hypothetical protein
VANFVTVKCVRCGHIGILKPDVLARFSIRPKDADSVVCKALALSPMRESKRPGDPRPVPEGVLRDAAGRPRATRKA